MSGWKRAPSSSVKNATATGCAVCDAVLLERLDHLEAAEHAEVAVEPAAGAHGVDVRTDHHRRQRRVGARRACRRRCRWRRSTTARPRSRIHADHQIATVTVGVGERQPGAAPLAVRPVHRADLAQRLEPSDSRSTSIAVDGRRRHSVPGHMPAHRPKSNTAISRSASPNACTAPSNSCLPSSAVACSGVADVAVGEEVVRQPPEAHPAAEAHVPVEGDASRAPDARPAPYRTSCGREVQHDRRLVGATVHAHAQFARPATCHPGRAARPGGRGTSSGRERGAARGWPR